MRLTAKLAYSQLKTKRNRTFWTLAGIMLSTVMITVVFGFAASTDLMFKELLGESHYYNSIYNEMLLGMGAIFGSVIIATSVIVVSNSFRISAGERIKQFGILKSVGATKRQIAETIMYEGLFLAAAAIPGGVAVGLIIHYFGIQIANYLLVGINQINDFTINFTFIISWKAICLSVLVSAVTVLLSAWLPARKAAKIAAIVAIRGNEEVKIKPKMVRGGQYIGKLFGFEGSLAYKSLKRSRRNFRATVVSLTVSIILFIMAGDFGAQYEETAQLNYPGVEDANVVAKYLPPELTTLDKDISKKPIFNTLSSDQADEITQKLRKYPNTTVFGVGDDYHTFSTVISAEMVTPKLKRFLVPKGDKYYSPITFYATDKQNYASLCKLAGVPLGSNILVNYARIPGDEGKSIFAPFKFTPQTLNVTNQYDQSEFALDLHGVIDIRDIPSEIASIYVGNVMIVVPTFELSRYTWFVETDNSKGFTEYANKVLQEEISFEGSSDYLKVKDIEESLHAMRDVSRLIMVFIYGFISLLTLIGLTNVISTISTNVRSRAREFAVLQSIGMTPKGLSRMLNLESILCSAKALIFGIPLGIVGSYLRYHSFLSSPVELDFEIPWIPIVQCTLGVIAITWVTMRYSMSRLRGDNIVETIRSEHGL